MQNCTYEPTGPPVDGQTPYRCAVCDHERESHYPANLLHRNCPGPAAEQAARIAEAAARLGMPERETRRHAAALLRWAREDFPERDPADVAIVVALCGPCEHLAGDRCKHGGRCRGRRLPLQHAVRMLTEGCPGYLW